jgi:serine/threonine protein kinase
MLYDKNKEVLKYIETEFFQSRYTFGKYIGRGGFGFVVEGRTKERPYGQMAIKMIKMRKQSSSFEGYVKKEIAIHSKAAHPNIVKLLGVVLCDEVPQKF